MLSSLFANPWVLATLAAASLPFIIEWLFRRRKQQIELPTLKFLLENEEQEQIKKQDRILLILRTVGVIALVLAISRPLIQQSWLKGSGQRNVIIFIDNTASMNQQVGVDTSFRLAQKKAADIAANLPKDTPIAVGCLTDRAETVIDGEKDVNAVSSKIKAMKASAGAAPMSEGFTWIKEALERSGRSSAEVYLFSDMQKYSWKRPGAQAGEETKGFSELSSKCELYLVDVGGSPTFNYIVTDFAPVEWIVSTGMPAKFRATVEVKGKPPAGKKPTLTFLVDNQKKDVREIEVTEDKPVVVTFEHRFQHAGESIAQVLVEGDDHPIDNSRLYLCTVFDEVKILVVEDGGDSPSQESFFLTRAIAPPAHPGMDRVSRFGVQSVTTDQFFKENLDNYSALVLVANGAMNEALSTRLKRFVSEGGSLLLFMGAKASPYDYNKYLFEDGKGLLPCKLAEKAVTSGAGESLKFSGSNHPAMVDLVATTNTVNVGQYLPLDLKDGNAGNSHVVLSLSNDAPAVIDRPFGRGRVMLVTTSAGASWSSFPAAQEYPIMIQGLMKDLVGNPDARVNLNVGDHYEQPVYISSQHLLMTYPAGNKERLTPRQPTDVQNAWLVSFDHTNQQGLYAFTDVQKGVLARRQFVANLKSEEGDLSRLEESEFKNIFSAGNYTWVGPDRPVEDLASKLHTVTELSPYLLVILTIILATEAYLAAKFGRRRDEAV
jgi:hypothetical protein